MLDEKILSILRRKDLGYVSGEDMCRTAGVSRAAIWKHIEKLREEGYEIDASPHHGYRLLSVPDKLIPQEVREGLKTKILGRNIISYAKVDSTNDVAYSLAERGVKEGTVVLAEEQAKGKGRHGRRWVSPPRGGIYLSCVLRPKMPPNEIPRITLLAAEAVARAIRHQTNLSAMIKWPNDILINSKKVCGILTEMKAEQDTVDFVIIGIGVNVNTAARYLPKGASSLKEEYKSREGREEISRIGLTKKILEELERNYYIMKERGFEPLIEAWKDLSTMPGSRVKVILPTRTFEGQVHDIDLDGSLVVRLESGILEKIPSGDIVMIR